MRSAPCTPITGCVCTHKIRALHATHCLCARHSLGVCALIRSASCHHSMGVWTSLTGCVCTPLTGCVCTVDALPTVAPCPRGSHGADSRAYGLG